MEYFRGHKYPNGWSKSRLYEVFLLYSHFGTTDEDYELNLEFVKIDENNGEKNCAWFRDVDDELVVAELQFLDKERRLVINDQGFEFCPKPQERKRMKVFISYAKEDSDSAKKLFDDLTAKKIEPWIDQECLLAGENWEREIEQAIRSSDFFIALLSSKSVAKKGYVQKEIRRALNVLEQIPEKDVFLIPARLNDCGLPYLALEKIHWVDMFPDWETGLEKIVKAIKARSR